MELTKFQRDLISRLAAAALGLWLAYLALGCFRWGEGIRTDPLTRDVMQGSVRGRGRSGSALALPYTLMVGFGGAGAILLGFAVLPTRALYAINPRHWEPAD